MAQTMKPEQSRHERLIEYAAALRERFAEGVLAELQPLNQWVVWEGELADGKRKKVPSNPHYYQLHARSSVKIPKSWGSLPEALTALESGNYSGIGFMITPPLVFTAIELYGQDRFTTITTTHLAGTPTTIEQRQDALASLYNRFAPPVTETDNQNTGGLGQGHRSRNCPRKRSTTQCYNGFYQATPPATSRPQMLILCLF